MNVFTMPTPVSMNETISALRELLCRGDSPLTRFVIQGDLRRFVHGKTDEESELLQDMVKASFSDWESWCHRQSIAIRALGEHQRSLTSNRSNRRMSDLSMPVFAVFGLKDLKGLYLFGAQLQRARVLNVNAQGADLRGSNLTDSGWVKGSFKKAQLHKANLSSTRFNSVDFTQADFTEARFVGSELYHCNFYGANLDNVTFRNCTFRGCDLSDAKMDNVMEIADCNFEGNNRFPSFEEESVLSKFIDRIKKSYV